MTYRTRKYVYDFRGQYVIPATASGLGVPFTKADTSAVGTPTVQGINLGGVRLAFDATNEVQNLCLHMGDILPFDIDDLIRVEMICRTVAALNAANTVVFGVGSARNDTPDSVAANAWFRLQGDNNVLCETDDGVTDKDDVATGLTLGTAWKRFVIDFATGIQTREPPLASLGGKGNVQFYAGNANGSLRRVGSGTLFDMSQYSAGLQLMVQLQKTASANTDTFDILEATVEVKLPEA